MNGRYSLLRVQEQRNELRREKEMQNSALDAYYAEKRGTFPFIFRSFHPQKPLDRTAPNGSLRCSPGGRVSPHGRG